MSRILIIDDEIDIAELESDALTDEGFDVDIAHLATEANILLEKNNYNYDLILLDIMMPGKSGTEYLNEIRNKITCPIIFVSAKSGTVDKLLGLEIGADDYITKPFDIYDRIYLDDYYQVPEEKRGATYIPEIRVIAKGQDDSSLKLPMRLNQIAKSHNIQLKKDPFKEDLSWLTPQMMQSMNENEILDEAKKHGFKQGGKLNYLNYINS